MFTAPTIRDRIITCEWCAYHCRCCGDTAGEAFWIALACDLRLMEKM